MAPIYYFMKKIWCETALVFDEFEIDAAKRQNRHLLVKIGTKVVKYLLHTFDSRSVRSHMV